LVIEPEHGVNLLIKKLWAFNSPVLFLQPFRLNLSFVWICPLRSFSTAPMHLRSDCMCKNIVNGNNLFR
jgi:hypothetical protein